MLDYKDFWQKIFSARKWASTAYDDQLKFALKDALSAAMAIGGDDMHGKDTEFYIEEANVYNDEIIHRRRLANNRKG